jgi:hypothetical protein
VEGAFESMANPVAAITPLVQRPRCLLILPRVRRNSEQIMSGAIENEGLKMTSEILQSAIELNSPQLGTGGGH